MLETSECSIFSTVQQRRNQPEFQLVSDRNLVLLSTTCSELSKGLSSHRAELDQSLQCLLLPLAPHLAHPLEQVPVLRRNHSPVLVAHLLHDLSLPHSLAIVVTSLPLRLVLVQLRLSLLEADHLSSRRVPLARQSKANPSIANTQLKSQSLATQIDHPNRNLEA